MTRNGIAFQLPPLALLTEGIASGSLPTPTASDANVTRARPPEKMIRKDGRNVLRTPSLAEMMLQPDNFPYSRQDLEKQRNGESYQRAKIRWPTPCSRDWKDTARSVEALARMGKSFCTGKLTTYVAAVELNSGNTNPTSRD